MRLLDRYIVRNFLQPYLYCILGFISIWLIFDISDNISQLFDERTPLGRWCSFYAGANPAGPCHSPAGLAPARASLFVRQNVARERDRFHAHRRA